MQVRPDVLAAIGNTPLIKLKRASEETGCTILGKAEFMNPGQSVKDRAARSSAASFAPAARLSTGPRATPASASPWSATRWA